MSAQTTFTHSSPSLIARTGCVVLATVGQFLVSSFSPCWIFFVADFLSFLEHPIGYPLLLPSI
jgi:hypothetical protein